MKIMEMDLNQLEWIEINENVFKFTKMKQNNWNGLILLEIYMEIKGL